MIMAQLEPDLKKDQVFMIFGHYNSVMGDVTPDAADHNLGPYNKGSWADIRKVEA
jgi:arsenite oxidase large subunit